MASQPARLFRMEFASVYPLYRNKIERKGRSAAELNAVIQWLTGYDERSLQEQLDRKATLEEFFRDAPRLHPHAAKITGMICGYRVEAIADPLLRHIRCLDKLVDELARGKPLDSILRK